MQLPSPPRALQAVESHGGLTPHVCGQCRCISFGQELQRCLYVLHLETTRDQPGACLRQRPDSTAQACVVGASVVDASGVGTSVVGASVVGAIVAGTSVVRASVVGASVMGASVVGASVVSAWALPFPKCSRQPCVQSL